MSDLITNQTKRMLSEFNERSSSADKKCEGVDVKRRKIKAGIIEFGIGNVFEETWHVFVSKLFKSLSENSEICAANAYFMEAVYRFLGSISFLTSAELKRVKSIVFSLQKRSAGQKQYDNKKIMRFVMRSFKMKFEMIAKRQYSSSTTDLYPVYLNHLTKSKHPNLDLINGEDLWGRLYFYLRSGMETELVKALKTHIGHSKAIKVVYHLFNTAKGNPIKKSDFESLRAEYPEVISKGDPFQTFFYFLMLWDDNRSVEVPDLVEEYFLVGSKDYTFVYLMMKVISLKKAKFSKQPLSTKNTTDLIVALERIMDSKKRKNLAYIEKSEFSSCIGSFDRVYAHMCNGKLGQLSFFLALSTFEISRRSGKTRQFLPQELLEYAEGMCTKLLTNKERSRFDFELSYCLLFAFKNLLNRNSIESLALRLVTLAEDYDILSMFADEMSIDDSPNGNGALKKIFPAKELRKVLDMAAKVAMSMNQIEKARSFVMLSKNGKIYTDILLTVLCKQFFVRSERKNKSATIKMLLKKIDKNEITFNSYPNETTSTVCQILIEISEFLEVFENAKLNKTSGTLINKLSNLLSFLPDFIAKIEGKAFLECAQTKLRSEILPFFVIEALKSLEYAVRTSGVEYRNKYIVAAENMFREITSSFLGMAVESDKLQIKPVLGKILDLKLNQYLLLNYDNSRTIDEISERLNLV